MDPRSDISNLLNLINGLPCLVFQKDQDSHYVYTSKYLSNWDLGINSEESVGKSDFEMPWYMHAEKFIEQDKLTLKGVSQFNLDPLPRIDGTTLLNFCHKMPIYNEKRTIIGVGGFGFELTLENYRNIFTTLKTAGYEISNFIKFSNKKQRYFDYKNISFSKRQAEIISFILRGSTAESTASELNLSKRTVEFYFSEIKMKLDCNTKQDLIKKAFEMGFIDLMFLKF